ncbi:MAG TPA: hypothetical protein VH619_15005 [Verrucomicrobiae bacterium]|jgi:hypothetical protein|nr:hypothetical protein [Verrucomicrobiae bacterium]
MEINSNLSTTGVNAGIPSSRSAPAQQMPSDRISLTNASALEDSLQSLPFSRPEVVQRAKSLIADSSYPSASTMGAVAQHMAVNLSSENW